MKKLIDTIRNIFKIEELRNRILYTLGLLLIYRLGSFVVLPGINPEALAGSGLRQQTEDGILGLLDIFSGGAFSNASIFALGIMPYISASIVIQLLGIAIPYFQKLQKEGESGRRKINQWTRYLTIGILLIQAPAYLVNLNDQLLPSAFVLGTGSFLFTFSATMVLIAGTMFVMWLGEKITDKGIGNGVSLIIMIGIIARLPHAFLAELNARFTTAGGGFVMLIVELVLLFLVFAATIALVQAVRKIPVQYAKRIVGNKQYGGVRQYIPLKINAAGVMPIIFAQAIMMLPLIFTKFEATQGFGAIFGNIYGFWYNLVFGILVMAFTYFYTAITINTNQMSDDMKRNGGFIPGIKPGKQTASYLDTIMTRITLPGSIFLAVIAILPVFARMIGVDGQFALFYGGTSLLILVGVVLDTLQQIESHLLLRHYDGLMKSGRMKGRMN
ncbi:preprotein translocase subunit SecY [uncultured Rikenella sp.]|uniref:preprotein translocase subunit SecY n=1 Tax=uncultured Rikenella sp. TaxID=368003 RepID=UPI00260214AA|nr:preprotein translocase subunit SecY [uncultured Rikenella sp.]